MAHPTTGGALRTLLALTAEWVSDAARDPGGELRVRASPPVLRPLAAAAIVVATGLLLVVVALFDAWHAVGRNLERRVDDAARLTGVTLQEVSSELGRLRVEGCGPAARESLARASFDSVMAREFFVEFSQEEVCGPLGPVMRAWPAVPLAAPTVFPVDRMDGLLLRQPHPQGIAAALIAPRQILDRLGEVAGASFSLRAAGGWTLIGDPGGERRQGADAAIVSRPVPGWPIVAEAVLDARMLRNHIASRAVLWTSLWVLAFIVAIGGANALLAARAGRRRQVETALRKRRFVPVVQPIVDAGSGACVGVEVLMRWKHPARGLVSPVEFIDFAERSGLIVPMSDLVMRTARDQLAEVALEHPGLYFSFNVTPGQLRRPDFCAEMLAVFDGDPIDPSRVVVELTERDLVDTQVREMLGRLRDAGFRVAIDDFGTGQSSLALLQNLAIDRLKIDREFVRTIGPDATDHPVLDAIVGLAHRLHISMIAEGVETTAQHQRLATLGVQALQGYLFARPMAPIELGPWLAKQAQGSAPVPARQSLHDIVQALRAAPRLVGSRWYRLRRYPDCILGSELTDWLVDTLGITRQRALRIGQRIVARGWLVHVAEEHDFEDGPYFYRLVPLHAQEEGVATAGTQEPEPVEVLGWLQGPRGVSPGARAIGLLSYRSAVSGHEIVEALARVAGLSHERLGLLRHVDDEFGFEDSRSRLYTFT
ncbi:MAG: EAL domain-containing protein [Burkholderiales bacterium]|nr:EAL domain-containing protein [Burkholderiales bacterium]